MLSTKIIVAASAAAILTAGTAAPARAQGQPADSRTEFTFNQPVEVPGATLPPGTYAFYFVDTGSGARQIMRVESKDAKQEPHAMFFTLHTQRPVASDEAELRFMETSSGQPAAVKTWWYPGQKTGREFIYPKDQARRLAQATNQPVLTTRADSATDEQMASTDLSYISPTGQETAMTDDQLVDAAANTAPQGSAVGTSGQQGQEGMARTSLPRTASPVPTAALIGFLALLGAAAIRGYDH